jgi:hypothetical protein
MAFGFLKREFTLVLVLNLLNLLLEQVLFKQQVCLFSLKLVLLIFQLLKFSLGLLQFLPSLFFLLLDFLHPLVCLFESFQHVLFTLQSDTDSFLNVLESSLSLCLPLLLNLVEILKLLPLDSKLLFNLLRLLVSLSLQDILTDLSVEVVFLQLLA